MKIAYINQYFRTPEMAGGTRSYEMGRRLAAAGHDVQMIASDFECEAGTKRRWRTYEISGIDVHSFPIPYSNRMSFRRRLLAFFEFAWVAARRTLAIKPDLVFASSTPLTVAFPAVWASKRLGIPMVFEIRDLWPEVPIAAGALKDPVSIAAARWLERFAYRHAVYVVALSPGMKAGVARTGFPEERIHVIPNASDNELFGQGDSEAFFSEHPHLRAGPLVTYAGTLGHINGVGYLVEIAAAMEQVDRTVCFLIVGDGAQRERIAERARSLGVLGRNLWMIDRVSKHRMPAVLAASELSISLCIDLPELWNNSANKFFDALAAERPQAVNYRGWQADLLEQTGAGIVLPASSPEAAARLLYEFLEDREAIAHARSAARALAEERFDRDLLASRLLTVLESSLGRQAL